ncbi:MAG: hypothetical protein Q8R88_05365 [Desulfoprunum sp.]|nr:hypothetical protein [Desulfoprunum sp.]
MFLIHHTNTLNGPMNIFLYAAGNPAYAEKLLNQINSLIDLEQVFLLPADFPLSAFLDFDMHSGDVLVLILADRKELDQLLDMKELLQDFRLILILPDDGEETVARGHLLMPRYLSFINSDMTESIRVLGRMITHQHV